MLSKLIIKNVKTGKASYVTTAFVVGVFIVNLKLLLSGMQLPHNIKMSEFSGTDYAAAMTALSALWVSNKHVNNLQLNKEEQK